MKALQITLITIVLSLCTTSLTAQDELYRKYSGKEGVTKVYISEAMFSLFKGSGALNLNVGKSDVVNIGGIMQKLTGLYIIACDNISISKEMEIDFDHLIQNYHLELLMEIEDNSDTVKMYIAKEGKIIKNFFMKVKENDGSLTIMYFKGNISESDLSKIINTVQ